MALLTELRLGVGQELPEGLTETEGARPLALPRAEAEPRAEGELHSEALLLPVLVMLSEPLLLAEPEEQAEAGTETLGLGREVAEEQGWALAEPLPEVH